MEVRIQNMKSERQTLTLEKNSKVSDLKKKIGEVTKNPADKIRIVFDGKVLKDVDNVPETTNKPIIYFPSVKKEEPNVQAPSSGSGSSSSSSSSRTMSGTQQSSLSTSSTSAITSSTASSTNMSTAEAKTSLDETKTNATTSGMNVINGINIESVLRLFTLDSSLFIMMAGAFAQRNPVMRIILTPNMALNIMEDPAALADMVKDVATRYPDILRDLLNHQIPMSLQNQQTGTASTSASTSSLSSSDAVMTETSSNSVANRASESSASSILASLMSGAPISSASMRQLMRETPASGMPGLIPIRLGRIPAGGMPGRRFLRGTALTEEEKTTVNRLTELGYSTELATQAYLACDKNEEMAANFLLNTPDMGHSFDDEDVVYEQDQEPEHDEDEE